jgi:uncharacterized protein (TIGR04255 family)
MSLIRVDAARAQFTDAPVALVACQLNFEPIMRLADPTGVAPFQEAIRATYPSASRVAGLQLMLGGAGIQTEPAEASGAWAFASPDQMWQVTLSPDALTIQTKQHESYEDLRERFVESLKHFIELCDPGARVRLGLRYINRLAFEDVTSVEDWRQIVRPELLGLAAAPELADDETVRHAFGQARFAGEESQLVVRHGLLEPGSVTHPDVVPPETRHFVLDLDAFDVRRFDAIEVDDVMAQLDDFHDDIHRLFRWSLTDAGAERFGVMERTDTGPAAVEVEA